MSNENAALGGLPPGSSGVIHRVRCERSVARRLMELGLLPGTRIEVIRAAPMGDPIELRVRGYALSLRRAEASGLELCDVRRPDRRGALTASAASTTPST